MKTTPVKVQRTLNAPVSLVWKALTDPSIMKEWYFDVPEFKAVPGSEFTFEGGAEDRIYNHLCKVIEVIPEKKLSYSWKYEGYEGSSIVTFLLTSDGNKTNLEIIHEGLESFPPDNKDFASSNFNQGWNEISDTLKKYVEGKL